MEIGTETWRMADQGYEYKTIEVNRKQFLGTALEDRLTELSAEGCTFVETIPISDTTISMLLKRER